MIKEYLLPPPINPKYPWYKPSPLPSPLPPNIPDWVITRRQFWHWWGGKRKAKLYPIPHEECVRRGKLKYLANMKFSTPEQRSERAKIGYKAVLDKYGPEGLVIFRRKAARTRLSSPVKNPLTPESMAKGNAATKGGKYIRDVNGKRKLIRKEEIEAMKLEKELNKDE